MPPPDTVARLPLDDLAGFAELVGNARVVASAENSRYIRGFSLLRADVMDWRVADLAGGAAAAGPPSGGGMIAA